MFWMTGSVDMNEKENKNLCLNIHQRQTVSEFQGT